MTPYQIESPPLMPNQWNDDKNRLMDRNVCSNMELKEVMLKYKVAKAVVPEDEKANAKTKSPVLRAITEKVVVTKLYRQFRENKMEATPSPPQHRRSVPPRRNSLMHLICRGTNDALPTKQPSQENLMTLVRISSEPLFDIPDLLNENRSVAPRASAEGAVLLQQQEHQNGQEELPTQLDEADSFTIGLCFEECKFECSRDNEDDENPHEMDQLRVYL